MDFFGPNHMFEFFTDNSTYHSKQACRMIVTFNPFNSADFILQKRKRHFHNRTSFEVNISFQVFSAASLQLAKAALM